MRLRDVSAAIGLTHTQSARRTGAACLFSVARLKAKFPRDVVRATSVYPKEQCIPERMTAGVAVGDFDNDGWPDLYLSNLDGPGRLYRNSHRSTFVDVTQSAGLSGLSESSSGAAWLDIDNDGRADLVVTTIAGHRNYLFHNQGHGHFREIAIERGVANDDGHVHSGFSVNVGDFDGDGFIDFATSEWRLLELAPNSQPSHSRLFRNLGRAHPGFFEDVTDRAGVALETRGFGVVAFATALTDLDGDRHPDFVSANDFLTSRLFWNDGTAKFREGTKAAHFATEENGMGLTIGDYNGDGRPDVFVSSVFDKKPCPYGQCVHGSTGNRMYANLGGREFRDATSEAKVRNGQWGWGAAFVDMTNSGLLDLVMTSGVAFPWESTATEYAKGPSFLFRNDGRATFSDQTLSAGMTVTGPGKGLALLDYDRDGRMDILIARDGATPVMYHNESSDVGGYLNVKLVGSASNRAGIGATIEVLTKPGTSRAWYQHGSVSHFLGQSETNTHIGLGSGATHVAELLVRWPSGRISRLTNVSANTTLTVREPSR